MKKYPIALLALPLAIAPASAQSVDDAGSFKGPNLTLIAGVDGRHTATADMQLLYGLSAGYDVPAGRARIGVELEATGATGGSCSYLGATTQFCYSNGRDLYAGGRVGVVAGPVLIYGKAGYTNARTRFERVSPSETGGSFNLDGARVGAGVELGAGRLLARAEYRYSNYEGGFDGHQGIVGVGLRF